ncbi:hypothetical protein [Gynurincola endophyticus]|uniref:hypothetical protein n=1 Tax=Gynurincola endophyticus TaxID=2479004 RepID=UPI000F8D9422|nr:hypothetical protein [Gynurincola endophyticus]
MTTEGVKILENEIAEETYWAILDLYDSGNSFDQILQQKPFPSAEITDAVEQENYISAYALAAWEIGMLNTSMLTKTREIIQAGAGVKDWTESFSDAMGKARQKELQKLLEKISVPNTKIRKPKKYKTVDKLLFKENDVISFHLPNKNSAAAVVLNIIQQRGICTYFLGKLVYNRPEPPTVDMIQQAQIVGDKGSSKSGMLALSLFSTSEEDAPFGLYMISIDHKKFSKFAEQFKVIGNVLLQEQCKTASSVSTSNTFEDLLLKFNTPEQYYKVSRNKLYNIKELLR